MNWLSEIERIFQKMREANGNIDRIRTYPAVPHADEVLERSIERQDERRRKSWEDHYADDVGQRARGEI